MPIHVALCHNHVFAAGIVLDDGAFYINDAGETPLHVFARCGNTLLYSGQFSI